MSFSETTITEVVKDATGKNLNGRVEATLSGVMQKTDGSTQVVPKTIKAKIVNGALSMKLYATDEADTRPEGLFYTFKITIQGGPEEEFKAPVPAEPETTSLSALRKLSGSVGVPYSSRPELSAYSSMQAI